MSERPFSVHWLASQPLNAQQTAIQALNPDQLLKLRHEWSWWARDEQKPPPGGWRVWLYLAGTRCWKKPAAGPNGFGRRDAGSDRRHHAGHHLSEPRQPRRSLASRSSRVTISTSSASRWSSNRRSCARSVLAPLTCTSRRTFLHPALVSCRSPLARQSQQPRERCDARLTTVESEHGAKTQVRMRCTTGRAHRGECDFSR